MLTSRGCWFLLSVLVILALGLLRPSLLLTLLGLTLLLWFAGQWLWFLVRQPSVPSICVTTPSSAPACPNRCASDSRTTPLTCGAVARSG